MTKRPQLLPSAPRTVVAFVFAISFMSLPALAQEPAPSSALNPGTSPQPQETSKDKGGKGTFFHRSGYALSRIFITRTNSGSNQFNYSEIAAAAVSAGLANSYHPTVDRNFAKTMSIWGTDTGWDAFTFVVKEFWPDIRRKLHRDKN